MEDKVPLLMEEFCENIDIASSANYIKLKRSLDCDLQLRNNTEKCDYIKSKRIELREKLEYSDYKTTFSINGIETDLRICLEKYFGSRYLFWIEEIEYNKSLADGESTFDLISGIYSVKSQPFFRGPFYRNIPERRVDFAILDDFKPIVQYIAWGRLFLEVNRLDEIYNSENICYQENEISKINSSVKEYSEAIKTEVIDKTTFSTDETIKPSKLLQYFKAGAYELFCYLETEYSMDDENLPTKYSNLYHFLKNEQLISCKQKQYIEFIEEEMGVKMSKIFPQNFKFKDIISPLLGRLKSDFVKRNKKEMN